MSVSVMSLTVADTVVYDRRPVALALNRSASICLSHLVPSLCLHWAKVSLIYDVTTRPPRTSFDDKTTNFLSEINRIWTACVVVVPSSARRAMLINTEPSFWWHRCTSVCGCVSGHVGRSHCLPTAITGGVL